VIQYPFHDPVEHLILEEFDAINAANGAGFGELPLVGQQSIDILLAQISLADALVMETKVGENAR
jgi:hypothetical protein